MTTSASVDRKRKPIAKLVRDQDGCRRLNLGNLSLCPMGGGYWSVERLRERETELVAAWISRSEVRELISKQRSKIGTNNSHVKPYDEFCELLNIIAYDHGAELGSSLELYETYREVLSQQSKRYNF